MKMNRQPIIKNWIILLFVVQISISCSAAPLIQQEQEIATKDQGIVLGNERTEQYLPLLQGKRVGFVGNHTSLIGSTHLVDSLLNSKVNIVKVFSPEHGFRGTADAGETVANEMDEKTGLPIISLYGKNKKPSSAQLEGIDVILFDIQDVGVRFYTYISTLHYVMEAAAENDIFVVALDRPNPNGHYVDGPILEEKHKSFVGMHPVPVVHGMTIGEYAKMINGEKWLSGGIQCNLKVVECLNYSHDKPYSVNVPPSPNLPNMNSIYLYPSLCFFEGTPISVGRGTDAPFQQFGHPQFSKFVHSFTPKPSYGAKNPKLNGTVCYGQNFIDQGKHNPRNWKRLDLSYLITSYQIFTEKDKYFTNFFNLLAGNSSLKEDIKAGKSEEEIRFSWLGGLAKYELVSKKYLLYEK